MDRRSIQITTLLYILIILYNMHQTYVLRFSISIGKWEPSNEPSNPSWCCRTSTSVHVRPFVVVVVVVVRVVRSATWRRGWVDLPLFGWKDGMNPSVHVPAVCCCPAGTLLDTDGWLWWCLRRVVWFDCDSIYSCTSLPPWSPVMSRPLVAAEAEAYAYNFWVSPF